MKNALKKSEEQLELAVECGMIGMWNCDIQTGDIRFNRLSAEILGYSSEEIAPDIDAWMRLIHPDDLMRVTEALNANLEGKTGRYECEHRVRSKSMGWRWIQARGKVVERGKDGTAVRHAGVFFDVTERKLMEAEKENLFDDLKERVKELKCLYSISSLVERREMTLAAMIRKIVRLIPESWQYPEVTCTRIIVEGNAYTTETFRETEWKQGREIKINGEPIGSVEVFYTARKPDRDEGPFSKEERDLLNAIAERLGDVIEFKQAENRLKEAKEEAEAANRAKTVFLANMNHELRTPLNTILGFAQLINTDPDLPVKQRENTRIMLESGNHLLYLINDILKMSKIESDRISLKESPFDLSELLMTVEKMIGHRLGNKAVGLRTEAGPNLPVTIKADEGKLRQILINLLGNAVKFTEKGSIVLRVGCMKKTQSDDPSEPIRIFFEIEDTGSGIPPEEIESVFEAFGQSHNLRRKPEGSGLGLTISRKFVRLMGGNIRVTSQVGVGTTFKFDILATPVEESIRPKHKRGSFILAPGRSPRRILIVEDDALNCLMLSDFLKKAGFETKSARDGEDAIKMYKAYAPDLIWMDLQLPDMDGFQIMKQIRELEMRAGRPRTPIIALTANSFDHVQKAALAEGFDAFLPKPFHGEKIFGLMQEFLGVRYMGENPEVSEETRISHENILAWMADLPADLVAMIQNDVTEGHRRRIVAHIEDVRRHNSDLADVLGEMARKFKYKQLLSLIDDLKK